MPVPKLFLKPCVELPDIYISRSFLQVHPCGRYRHNSLVFLLAKEHKLLNLHSESLSIIYNSTYSCSVLHLLDSSNHISIIVSVNSLLNIHVRNDDH